MPHPAYIPLRTALKLAGFPVGKRKVLYDLQDCGRIRTLASGTRKAYIHTADLMRWMGQPYDPPSLPRRMTYAAARRLLGLDFHVWARLTSAQRRAATLRIGTQPVAPRSQIGVIALPNARREAKSSQTGPR